MLGQFDITDYNIDWYYSHFKHTQWSLTHPGDRLMEEQFQLVGFTVMRGMVVLKEVS